MESVTGDDNFGKHGQEFVHKTADKLRSGIRNAKDTANTAGDSVVSYTRDNPVTTILISAAAGALIATVVSALLPSRE